MATILIKNADIVTLDAENTIHTGTDLLIDEGRIAAIGNVTAEVEEVIDAGGRVVMPGFFNAHCHSPMTFERGWAEDLPFPRWLNEKIWVAESALTPDDVYWGAMLAACEMIKSGTVGFNDHYFHMHRVAEVVVQSGLRANLTSCVFGIGANKEIGEGLEGALEFCEQYHDLVPGGCEHRWGRIRHTFAHRNFWRPSPNTPKKWIRRFTFTSRSQQNRSKTRAKNMANRPFNC